MNAPNEHDTVEPEPIEVPGDDSPDADTPSEPVMDEGVAASAGDDPVASEDDSTEAAEIDGAPAAEAQPLADEPVAETSDEQPDAVVQDDATDEGDSAAVAGEDQPLEVEDPVEEVAEEAVDVASASSAGGDDDLGDGGEEKSMMELLLEESEYLSGKMQRGDLVDGTVLRKDKDQLILDIGAKQEGIVPANDLSRLSSDAIDGIEVGDTVQAVVIRPEGREGEVLVSLFQARTVADWEKAQEYLDSGEILELEIVGYNKGGALVGFGNLQGFVPRSHLARPGGAPAEGAEGLAALAGQSVPVKVIEVSRRKRRLIMSERLATREWRSERKKRLLEQLQEGEIRKGHVSSVADFGAFVDLGGADGLVHISELTYERGKHPRDVVSVGQEVEVYVLSIDHDRKRIGLSMKRLQADPWLTVEEEHYVGELAEARISNLSKFGAFARLDDGLEGLIHISELADHHVEHPREVVKPGQRVTVEIIAIEPDRQRIGLSIRRVPPHLRTIEEPEPEAVEEPESAADDAPEAEVDTAVAETEAPEQELGTADDDADVEAETADEPADEPVDEPTVQADEAPGEEPTDEPADEPADEPEEVPADEEAETADEPVAVDEPADIAADDDAEGEAPEVDEAVDSDEAVLDDTGDDTADDVPDDTADDATDDADEDSSAGDTADDPEDDDATSDGSAEVDSTSDEAS